MTILQIESQIKKFLQSKTPEVIAIKGGWGTGKTFAWNKFLKQTKEEKHIGLEKYSYVSLFGINSLENLKYAIFEQIINCDVIGTQPDINSFEQITQNSFGTITKKALGGLKDASALKGFGAVMQSLSFLSITKTLICIDDLERRGSALSLKDVLGLVSQLKEQKNCKVILLLNDDAAELQDYFSYREKVIDCEIQFTPTAVECANIAFDKSKFWHEELSHQTVKLNINNIRILKKIERFILLSEKFYKNLQKETISQIIQSLTLFTWCYYCTNDKIPPLDFVLTVGDRIWSNDTDTENKDWKSVLFSCDFQFADALDIELADTIRRGYFIDEKIEKEIATQDKRFKIDSEFNSFERSLKSVYHKFDQNIDDLIERIFAKYELNIANVSTEQLIRFIKLLRNFDKNELATTAIDKFIETNNINLNLFNLNEADLYGVSGIDSEIEKKFNSTYATLKPVQSAEQVLERIADTQGWEEQDLTILSTTSEQEYYELFKSLSEVALRTYITKCLIFGRFSNSTEQHRQIYANASAALQRIAIENPLNKLIVQRFGIVLK